MLEVRDLHVHYGPVPAVRGIDLDLGAGEAVALLGRNGAGKSTTLRALAGLVTPTSGSIAIDGHDMTKVPAERRVRAGVALAPEGRGMFPQLTVRESLAMGAFHRRLRASAVKDEIRRVTERFPRLAERLDQRTGSLSGGEQQMLALARGLMSTPRLLMVDEPSLGLAPIIIEDLYELLSGLKADGITLLVVEQYVEVALDFADRAYVLDKGEVALSGNAHELASSRDLVEAYLSSTSEVRA
jgi:branched-chain amino acid transport system ATP-binding protein